LPSNCSSERLPLKEKGKKIIISEGNYEGKSKAWRRVKQMLNWIEEKGLLPYFKMFVCYQDSSVLHKIKTDPQMKDYVQVVYDPHLCQQGIQQLAHKRCSQVGLLWIHIHQADLALSPSMESWWFWGNTWQELNLPIVQA